MRVRFSTTSCFSKHTRVPRLLAACFLFFANPTHRSPQTFCEIFVQEGKFHFFQLALAVLAVLMGSSSLVRFTLASSPFLCPTLLRRTIQKGSCTTHNTGASPICVSSLCGYRDPPSYLMLLCFSTREYFSRYTDALGSSARLLSNANPSLSAYFEHFFTQEGRLHPSLNRSDPFWLFSCDTLALSHPSIFFTLRSLLNNFVSTTAWLQHHSSALSSPLHILASENVFNAPVCVLHSFFGCVLHFPSRPNTNQNMSKFPAQSSSC